MIKKFYYSTLARCKFSTREEAQKVEDTIVQNYLDVIHQRCKLMKLKKSYN